MAESPLQTLDSLIAEITSNSFTVGQFSQSARGWEVILFLGPIGYSPYTCTHSFSPNHALAEALSNLLNSENIHQLTSTQPVAPTADHNHILSILGLGKPATPTDLRRR